MNERTVILVVYAAVLGWVANSWWRAEKERIAWAAADELQRREQWLKDHPQPTEAPVGST
jgi:hypothetical protein